MARSWAGEGTALIKQLYRFRSIEKLLDEKYKELENQEIYFAAPEELNDPMEGFRDVFWKGDEIVWRNLFKHYLLCLNTAWCLWATCREEEPFGWEHIPIYHSENISEPPQQKDISDEICQQFLNKDEISHCIEILAGQALPIRRSELAVYLRNIHLFAISIIHDCYRRRAEAPKPKPELADSISKSLDAAKAVISVRSKFVAAHPDAAKLEAFFTAHRQMDNQLDFINRYNGTFDGTQKNRNFVMLDFPDEYVRQIDNLVYPNWYTACFMLECENASVWGSCGPAT